MAVPSAEGDESVIGAKASNLKGLDGAADEIPLATQVKGGVDTDGIIGEHSDRNSIDHGKPNDVTSLPNGVTVGHSDI